MVLWYDVFSINGRKTRYPTNLRWYGCQPTDQTPVQYIPDRTGKLEALVLYVCMRGVFPKLTTQTLYSICHGAPETQPLSSWQYMSRRARDAAIYDYRQPYKFQVCMTIYVTARQRRSHYRYSYEGGKHSSLQRRPAEIILQNWKGGDNPVLGTHTHPTQHDCCARIQHTL